MGYGEPASRTTYSTGQPEFASRIQKQDHALAHSIAFTRVPQTNPLPHTDVRASLRSAHGLFHAKGDPHGRHLRRISGWHIRDRRNPSREHVSCWSNHVPQFQYPGEISPFPTKRERPCTHQQKEDTNTF